MQSLSLIVVSCFNAFRPSPDCRPFVSPLSHFLRHFRDRQLTYSSSCFPGHAPTALLCKPRHRAHFLRRSGAATCDLVDGRIRPALPPPGAGDVASGGHAATAGGTKSVWKPCPSRAAVAASRPSAGPVDCWRNALLFSRSAVRCSRR